jgi:hypothetical protein
MYYTATTVVVLMEFALMMSHYGSTALHFVLLCVLLCATLRHLLLVIRCCV